MAGKHGIGLDVEYEPLRRTPCPKDRISLSKQGIVGGIYLHSVKVLGIESKPTFRGSYLPRVEGAASDQGFVGPGGRAHPYLFHT